MENAQAIFSDRLGLREVQGADLGMNRGRKSSLAAILAIFQREIFESALLSIIMSQSGNRRSLRLSLGLPPVYFFDRHRRLGLALLVLVSCGPLASGSASPNVLLSQIQDLVQQGDLPAASSQLSSAIKTFPHEPGFYNLLGVVEARQANFTAAESNLKKAVELLPQFTSAWLNLGRLYQEASNRDPGTARKALDAYLELLKFQPKNIEANYQAAVLFERQGAFQNSQSYLSHLPAEAQERAQALALRLANHAALGHAAQAQEAAERLLSSTDLSEADVVSIQPALEAHNQTDLELKLFQGLDARQLASAGSLYRLGVLLERKEKLPEARTVFEKVTAAQTPAAPLLLDLARVAYKQHDLNGALGYLAHARDLEPRNPGIHFFFGMVCVDLDLPVEARRSLTEAVRLDSENAYYNYALGAVAVQSRTPGDAIPYFQEYIAHKPEDPRGRFALGAAYFYIANYAAARTELHAVEKRPETAAGAHYFLGRIAKQEENLAQAESELRQAVAVNPAFADALAELAHVHIRMEKYADARMELERAREIDPDNFRVNANLLILYQKTKDARADAQHSRFEEIKQQRSENEQLLWRTIEVRPY
jgi:tetratricopeptide (TPR) repeat protein